jgi:hypothetical protein
LFGPIIHHIPLRKLPSQLGDQFVAGVGHFSTGSCGDPSCRVCSYMITCAHAWHPRERVLVAVSRDANVSLALGDSRPASEARCAPPRGERRQTGARTRAAATATPASARPPPPAPEGAVPQPAAARSASAAGNADHWSADHGTADLGIADHGAAGHLALARVAADRSASAPGTANR